MQEEFRAITIIELRQLKGDLELLWHRHYFEQKDAAMRKLFKRYLEAKDEQDFLRAENSALSRQVAQQQCDQDSDAITEKVARKDREIRSLRQLVADLQFENKEHKETMNEFSDLMLTFRKYDMIDWSKAGP